ncbi:MAG TPA: DUF3999 family protein, partial [Thermoanaerobaculia bacterium]|nr:DUF3999 family protein [Thermoanaerobaculia bacterium]
AADLHVFAPGGGELPVRVEPWLPRAERREAVVTDVQKTDTGWTLLLDTGTERLSHDGLLFDFDRATTVPAVRLEGSADGEVWRPLAVGDLFRVGEERGLQRISLSYPASPDRYLRLAWPEAGGYPRVSRVEVETAPGPSVTLTTRDVACEPRQGAAVSGVVCQLALPAPGQILRHITLEIEGSGTVGYLLDEPRDARWQPLARGVWQRAAGGGAASRHRLLDDPREVAGSTLRLQLHGPGEPPELVSFGVEMAVQTVVFEAGEPGLYTLAYGGTARRATGYEGDGAAAWVEAGPETAHPVPPLPPPLAQIAAPGARLPRARFAASWDVVAPSARPGDLVRLEIPDAVYGTARDDLGDLRLEMAGRQIPFFRWSPPEPAPAGAREDARPAESGEEGESQIGLSLPVSGLPLTELDLWIGARPLRRPVTVRSVDNRRRSSRQEETLARETWECTPEPPLPCRALLPLSPLPRTASGLLTVRFEDGDDPPLSGLDLELWRRRDVLLFAWPPDQTAKGPVRLLAGAESLGAPDYDLAALGDVLLSRAWQPAELDLAGTLGPGEAPWWSRWVMPVALIVAGTFLLLLLRRILSNS